MFDYNVNFIEQVCGKDNKLYYPKSAICLEAQFFPDSVNKVYNSKS